MKKIKVGYIDGILGFFPSDKNYKKLPNECIEITEEEYSNIDFSKTLEIKNGKIEEKKLSTQEKINALKQKLIQSRKSYLSSTDWYILREADQLNSYPDEIKQKRILARQEINEIEEMTTLTALNKFNENF